jgi:hypothetical protein
VLVDRFFAYPGASFETCSSTYHLWSPTVTQTSLCVRLDFLGESARSGSSRPLLGHPMRLLRLVAASSRVPGYLTADRACRSPQLLGNLALSVSGLTPHTDQPTFCIGHAFVSHCVLHVLLAHEERTLPRDHSHPISVALAASAHGRLRAGERETNVGMAQVSKKSITRNRGVS